MADYAELIKREVVEIEGMDRVDIYGERSECINISLLQDRMAKPWRETGRSPGYLERTKRDNL